MTISASLRVCDASQFHERVYQVHIELPPSPAGAEVAEAVARTLINTLADRANEDFPPDEDEEWQPAIA